MDDPNVTLSALLQAIVDQDHEAYTEALEALLAWDQAGGFMPAEHTAAARDRVARLRQWLRQLVESALVIEGEFLKLLPLLERAGLLRLGHTLTMRLFGFIARTPKPPDP